MAILRQVLLEGQAVSAVCEAHDLSPTLFYTWQKQFFENGAAAFAKDAGAEQRELARTVEVLRERLGQKSQPITALSQRVQVPPQQGSRQLRSDTRLRRGVTCGGASSGVKVSATSKGVGLVERRATLRAGAQAKAGDASKWDTCQEARDRTTREPSPTLLGEGDDGGEGAGPAHPSFPPAYRHWHAEKGE